MTEVDSTSTAGMAPDERTFKRDIASKTFELGTKTDRWRLDYLEWPYCVIAVFAAPRDGAPSEFSLRFELSGYPIQAPTSMPWDRNANQKADVAKLPVGRRASGVFRRDGWNEGNSLYAPYDRLALPGHPDWGSKYPHLCWKESYDITFYLEQIHGLLHDEDYDGV